MGQRQEPGRDNALPVQIVSTVTASSMAELRAARDAVHDADIVELRLDGVRDVDVAGALQGRRLPAIVTCRASWEGGRFDGAEDERLAILGGAIRAGAEFVDVEWKADRRSLPRGSGRLVLSHHDFDDTPSDAAERLAAMRHAAPDAVAKLAVTTESLTDVVRLADAAVRVDGDRVVIGMGAPGTITRVCPWLFGSVWTYGGHAAPGQLTVDALQHRYRVRTGSASRRLFGITGAPLDHSASPAMHNAAFSALGIDAVYVPLPSRDVIEFLRAAECLGVQGASVTAPMKLGWERAGVDLADDARDAGAVNTLKRQGATWAGRNFDVAGFLDPLDARGVQLSGLRALVLGAGGAARAAVRGLVSRGAAAAIASRRGDAAGELAASVGASTIAWPPTGAFDLIVNATPVGTHPRSADSPVTLDDLEASLVYDLVYNPADTALLRAARKRGFDTIGGLDMLVGQARRQFEYWTGQAAPVDVMVRAAQEFLGLPESQR